MVTLVSSFKFQGNLMFTTEEEGFNMLELSITEQEPVFTEQALWLLSINSDNNITDILIISGLGVGKGN